MVEGVLLAVQGAWGIGGDGSNNVDVAVPADRLCKRAVPVAPVATGASGDVDAVEMELS